MKPTKTDHPKGALDLLILKVVAPGPVYGSAEAVGLINRMSEGGAK